MSAFAGPAGGAGALVGAAGAAAAGGRVGTAEAEVGAGAAAGRAATAVTVGVGVRFFLLLAASAWRFEIVKPARHTRTRGGTTREYFATTVFLPGPLGCPA